MRVLHPLVHTAVPLPKMAAAIARYGMPGRVRRGIEAALAGRVLKPRYRAMEARLEDDGSGVFFRVYRPSRFYLARANLHAHDTLKSIGIGVAERLGCGFIRHGGQLYFVIADNACDAPTWRDLIDDKAVATTVGAQMARLHDHPLSRRDRSSFLAAPAHHVVLEQKLARAPKLPADLAARVRADIAAFGDAAVAGPIAFCQTDPTTGNFIVGDDGNLIWIDLDTIRVAQVWFALTEFIMAANPIRAGILDVVFRSYFEALPNHVGPWRRARLPWLRLRLGARLVRAVVGPEVPEHNRWDSADFCRALYDAAGTLTDNGGPESEIAAALYERAGVSHGKLAS